MLNGAEGEWVGQGPHSRLRETDRQDHKYICLDKAIDKASSKG